MKANYGKQKKDQGFPIIAPTRHAAKKSTQQPKKQAKSKKAQRSISAKGRT